MKKLNVSYYAIFLYTDVDKKIREKIYSRKYYCDKLFNFALIEHYKYRKDFSFYFPTIKRFLFEQHFYSLLY